MASNTLERIDKTLNDTPLYSLLQADGMAELRSRVIDTIVERVRDDLEDSRLYLISPDDITDALNNNIIEDALEELKEEYRDKVKNFMRKSLDSMLGE